MALIYIPVGLVLAYFAIGIAPFHLLELFGKKGLIIGWTITLYLWTSSIVWAAQQHHPPRGLSQLVWLLTWWMS